jgi:beta-lactamase regulating signal transducer with metallopeptidase domain
MTLVAIETLNAWGSAWAGAMCRSLVEGTALLVLVGLAWLLLRRRASSAFLHGLFLLVLIKAALPITLPYTLAVSLPRPLAGVMREESEVSIPQPQPPTRTQTVEPNAPEDLVNEARAVPSERLASLPAAGPEPSVESGPKPSLAVWLMLAWAVVAASLLARFVVAHVRMARRLRGARLVDPDELPVDPIHLAALAGLWRPVPIVETDCATAPGIWGLVRPRLLVPSGLIESLPKEQLTWAFLHELMHVRRGDSWILLFQRLIQIVFFCNPAVWVANRAADVLREFACDDASLALAGVARHDCGAGFLAIAERACRARPSSAPIALGLFGSSALIHKRLERILDDGRPLSPRLSWGAVTLLGVAALAVLPTVRAQPLAPEPFKTARNVAPRSTVDPKIRTLELVVVDGKTKTTLKDAMVTALVDGTSTEGTTDGNGRFMLNIPDEEPRSVKIQVRKDGYVLASIEWNHPGEVGSLPPAAYTLPMDPGTTIGGLLKDSAGRPIAGVLVHVVSKGKGGDTDIREHSHQTDAEGRWQCREVPADLSMTWFRLGPPDLVGMTTDSFQLTFKNLEKERYQRTIEDILKTESELIEAESLLEVMQEAEPTDEVLNALIEVEFKKDPEVVGIIREIAETRDQLEYVAITSTQHNDPALVAVHKHRGKLMDRYENLWKIKYDEIRQRIRNALDPTPSAINRLYNKISVLKRKKERLTKNFEQLEVKNRK